MHDYFGLISSVYIRFNLHAVDALLTLLHFNFNCAAGDAPDSITLTSDLRCARERQLEAGRELKRETAGRLKLQQRLGLS